MWLSVWVRSHYYTGSTHRYFGRRMLLSLSSHPDFDKILEKYIPTKDLPTVRDTVFTLKTKVRCFLHNVGVFAFAVIWPGDCCFVFFNRVLVKCPKTPSQPGVDAPSQAVVQSGPHLSPESHSTRQTGSFKNCTIHVESALFMLYSGL